jgi:hypothetical protein
VRVADIHDERQFYDTFTDHLRAAQHSIWMWAPWTARRIRPILPVLADAVRRGVTVVVFVRDPSDTSMPITRLPLPASRCRPPGIRFSRR